MGVGRARFVLVLRSFELAKLAIVHGVKFALEHPEQLGLVKGLVPGSIWDFEEFHEILEPSSSTTFAFHQCQFQATSSKPTRILQCGVQWSEAVVHEGLPQLDADGRYLGPLPRACGHVRPPLLGKDEQTGKWKTAASAAYNARMCSWLASSLHRPTRLTGGGKADVTKDKVQPLSSEVHSPPSFQLRDVTWGELPSGLPEPQHDADRMAKQILVKGCVEPGEVENLLKLLPMEEASDRKGGGAMFATGAFRRGGLVGIKKNLKEFPWVSLLGAFILRGSHEDPSFTSCDVRTLIHTDANNEEQSKNYVTR